MIEFTYGASCQPRLSLLAFDFQVVGWRDWDDNIHQGRPSESVGSDGVQSAYVHGYDVDAGEDHWWWVHSYMRLGSWEEWLDLIAITMEMHGMSLA